MLLHIGVAAVARHVSDPVVRMQARLVIATSKAILKSDQSGQSKGCRLVCWCEGRWE